MIVASNQTSSIHDDGNTPSPHLIRDGSSDLSDLVSKRIKDKTLELALKKEEKRVRKLITTFEKSHTPQEMEQLTQLLNSDVSSDSPLIKEMDQLIKKAAKSKKEKGDDDEDDDMTPVKLNLIKHGIVIIGGGAVSLASALAGNAQVTLIAIMLYMKLTSKYMWGLPRVRRYALLTTLTVAAFALNHFTSVSLVALTGGLFCDSVVLTLKSWMKDKLSKDKGPKETNCFFRALERTIDCTKSCATKTAAKVWGCCKSLFCCSFRQKIDTPQPLVEDQTGNV